MSSSVRSRTAFALVASLGLMLCVSGPAFAQKKYALVVGINKYDAHKKLNPLRYAENDAEYLRNALESDNAKKRKGFDEVIVMTETTAKQDKKLAPTAKNIRAQLNTLEGKMKEDDVLLVALSGHGMSVEAKQKGRAREPMNFFCAADAILAQSDDFDTLCETMIPLGKLLRDWESVPGTKLLLVDACRKEFDRFDGADVLSPEDTYPRRGVAALFSCKANERSYETNKLAGEGHSIFVYHVGEALRRARNDMGQVTWALLAKEVPPMVQFAAEVYVGKNQTPQEYRNLLVTPVLVTLQNPANPDDLYRQAMASYTGVGDKVDYARALKLFTKAAEDDHALSQAALGWMLYFGIGTKQDKKKAEEWVKKALPVLQKEAKTDADAQTRLGALYSEGVVVKRDEARARELYELAVKKKNANAMNNLAVLLARGRGGEADPDRAVKLYEDSAALGHLQAMLNLAGFYEERKKSKDVFTWARKAAEKGHVQSMHNLGLWYREGEVVKKDEKEAMKWYREAADRDVPSSHSLALLLLKAGGAKNEKEAIERFEDASAKGYVASTYHLGVCYATGQGVKEDKVKARSYFEKAANAKAQVEEDHDAITAAKEALKKLGKSY